MFTRTRRLRRNFLTRELVKNISIEKSSLIYPLFVCDRLNEELDELLELGINNILLFGIPNHKDEIGSQAYDENGIVQRAVKHIRKKYQDKFLIVTDVCMCEYTSHGHCGILHNHDVDNDETLEYIAKIALSHAKAGVDIADSAPSFGDRKTYQMDFRSYNNFYREVEADIQEGADFIMVKPAMAYLDVIKSVSEVTNLPIVAYNVSGEYSMVKAAAKNNWIDEQKIVMENMYAIKRAGADIIITYHAKDIAKWLSN